MIPAELPATTAVNPLTSIKRGGSAGFKLPSRSRDTLSLQWNSRKIQALTTWRVWSLGLSYKVEFRMLQSAASTCTGREAFEDGCTGLGTTTSIASERHLSKRRR
jgi:hypothetical protein